MAYKKGKQRTKKGEREREARDLGCESRLVLGNAQAGQLDPRDEIFCGEKEREREKG